MTKATFLGLVMCVVVFIASTTVVLLVVSLYCHGQCFQTHDRGCQERCAAKEFCPMAGGDQ